MLISCTLATASGYIPKRKQGFESKICLSMGIVALFTITNEWKQPNSPQTEEKTNKMWLFIYLALNEREREKNLAHDPT